MTSQELSELQFAESIDRHNERCDPCLIVDTLGKAYRLALDYLRSYDILTCYMGHNYVHEVSRILTIAEIPHKVHDCRHKITFI